MIRLSRGMRRSRRRGYILVQTLIVIAALTGLMAIIVHDEHNDSSVTADRLQQRRIDAAVNAAVARSMSMIETETGTIATTTSTSSSGSTTPGSNTTNLVTLNDQWAQTGLPAGQAATNTLPAPTEYSIGQTGESFRMQIIDAGSLINLNGPNGAVSAAASATQTQAQTSLNTQLMQLPLQQNQVDSLVDWITANQVSTYSDGAKDPFYNGLPQPYNTKLGPLYTVDEALLVDNWTGQTLYQTTQTTNTANPPPTDVEGNQIPIAAMVTVDSGAPNTQAGGTARVNVSAGLGTGGAGGGRGGRGGGGRGGAGGAGSTALRTALARAGVSGPALTFLARPTTSFATLLSQRGMTTPVATALLNAVQFTSNTRLTGQININTAPQSVLMTIPTMTSTVAQAIVAQQASGFTSLGQVMTVGGLTPAQAAPIADYLSVGSDTWIVRAYGESGGQGAAVEAVIGIRNNNVQVITWSRIHTPGIPSWWDWQPSTTTEDAEDNT